MVLILRNFETRTTPLISFISMSESNSRFFMLLATLATIPNSARPQGCSRTYSGPSGIITSPNYPNSYIDNLDCFYTIQSSAQYSINITFQSFQTELCCDWLQIRCSIGPAKTSPKFQGAIMPPFLSFDSCSQLILQFHSDVSAVYKGFSLRYTIGTAITDGFIAKPSNVFFRQDPIVLRCASNAVQPNSYPWWYYSTDGITFTILTGYNCNLIYNASGATYSTQRISTSNACNLIIQSAARNAPVAVFTCTNFKLNNASAIVTFSDLATPVFGTNINSSLMEVVRGDEFRITCSMLTLLNPNPIFQIQPWIYMSTEEERIKTRAVYYSNTSLSIALTAQPDTLPSYTCNIHIDVSSNLSFDIAKNMLMLSNLSFTTKSYRVLYWPENHNMIITGDLNGTILSNGALQCYVPANPPATYIWRDEKLVHTTAGSVIYVSHNGIYTCTATNYIRGNKYQASKTINITVTAGALPRDIVLALKVGVVLGAAVLILLLIVIILCRRRKFPQASLINKTLDASANNDGRIFNNYDMAESTYANQSEMGTCACEDTSCSGINNQRDSEIYEIVPN